MFSWLVCFILVNLLCMLMILRFTFNLEDFDPETLNNEINSELEQR